MIDWWGPVIFEYYGSTEAGPLTFCGSDDWLAHRGTVGRPIEGVRLSIRGAAGKPCGAGEAGEICIDETFQPNFRSEEHTSELQSLMRISYAVFCLKKKKYSQLDASYVVPHVIHSTTNHTIPDLVITT